jgi:hypothetical protein
VVLALRRLSGSPRGQGNPQGKHPSRSILQEVQLLTASHPHRATSTPAVHAPPARERLPGHPERCCLAALRLRARASRCSQGPRRARPPERPGDRWPAHSGELQAVCPRARGPHLVGQVVEPGL